MSKPNILFQTDFGLGGAAAMYGVCKQVDNDLGLYDLTHTIPTFDVKRASASLRNVLPFWPKGTILVSVVDPGVGTARRACIAHTCNDYYIVTPDNGTLTYLMQSFGIDEVREIDETVNRYKGTEKTNIFHGRDLFAYCAAKLAAGVITYEQVGPAYPVSEIVTFPTDPCSVSDGEAEGVLTDAMDTFGNLETSISIDDFERTGIVSGDTVQLTITHGEDTPFDAPVIFHRSFGFVPEGDPVVYNSCTGYIGIALNRGNFAGTYHIGLGPDWSVRIRKQG